MVNVNLHVADFMTHPRHSALGTPNLNQAMSRAIHEHIRYNKVFVTETCCLIAFSSYPVYIEDIEPSACGLYIL